MAEIYNSDGNELTVGLQSSSVCDEALVAARNIARDLGESVYLSDDDERLTVRPDGTVDEGWGGDWDDDE